MDSLSLAKEQKVEIQPINRVAEAEKEAQKDARIQRELYEEESRSLAKSRNAGMMMSMPYDEASAQVDKLVKIINGILKNPSTSYFVSSREISKRILRIIEVYRPEFERVSQRTAMGDQRIKDINDVIDKCNETLSKEVEGDEEVETITSQIMESNEDEASEGLSTSVDNTLSAETMQGVLSIDRWMLSHMHETGFSSIWGENDKFAFVSRLLTLSARERLYMYYIIEKGNRHNVQNSDIIESQLSYVPNKKDFASKMKMSVFRIFRRVAMGKIYWDKLSDAYSQLESVRPAIQKYATIAQNKTDTKRSAALSGNYLRTNKTASKEQTAAFNKDLEQRNTEAVKRDACLDAFKNALVEYKVKKEIAEKAWVGKKKKNDAATAAANLAQQCLRELLESDEKVGRLEKNVRANGHGSLDGVALDTDGQPMTEEGFSKAEAITDASDRVIGNAGYSFSAVVDPIMDTASEALDLENGSKFLGLSESGLSRLSSVNLAALSVLATSNIISAVIAIADLSSESSKMMAGDLVSAVGDLVSQSLTALESLYTTFTAGVGKVNEFSSVLKDTVLGSMDGLENVASVVGITTASVALTANTISMVNSLSNSMYLQSSEFGFSMNRAINGHTDARRERYEDNMVRHQKRVLAEEKKSTAVDMVSNAALLTSALSGGTLSAVFGGISVGLCIYSTIRDSIMSRKMKRQSIDDYLGLSGKDNTLLNTAFQNYLTRTSSAREKYEAMDSKQKQSYKQDTIKKIKDNLRDEIMAKMGCASKTAFFNMIMEKYAEIAFNGAFMNGDNMITDPDELHNAAHMPYVDFISSLGLKIKFKNGALESPTKKTIITKLQG